MKKVMGIINVNDSSFYSKSRCLESSAIRDKINQMVSEGADIIDFGACSTRPGSTPVSEEEEWAWIKMALEVVKEELKDSTSPCGRLIKRAGQRNAISIDTFRSSVVEKAYDYIGEFTINDISAGEDDPQMLPTAGRLKLPYIAMHKRGTPQTMQQMCNYREGVVEEVIKYFKEFKDKALANSIEHFIIDPGLGFSKTVEQNYELLLAIGRLKEEIRLPGGEETPLLIGLSRKSMICKPLGITPEEALPATAALNLQALLLGADIIRVHDVAEGTRCVKLFLNLQPNNKNR